VILQGSDGGLTSSKLARKVKKLLLFLPAELEIRTNQEP
jgi:hypothetical protein